MSNSNNEFYNKYQIDNFESNFSEFLKYFKSGLYDYRAVSPLLQSEKDINVFIERSIAELKSIYSHADLDRAPRVTLLKTNQLDHEDELYSLADNLVNYAVGDDHERAKLTAKEMFKISPIAAGVIIGMLIGELYNNVFSEISQTKLVAAKKPSNIRRRILQAIGTLVGIPIALYSAGEAGRHIAKNQIERENREISRKDVQEEEDRDDNMLHAAEQSAPLIQTNSLWKPVLQADKNILAQSLERSKQGKYEPAIIANRYFRFGRICQLLGENDQAQEAYKQALMIDPSHELATYHLKNIDEGKNHNKYQQ